MLMISTAQPLSLPLKVDQDYEAEDKYVAWHDGFLGGKVGGGSKRRRGGWVFLQEYGLV